MYFRLVLDLATPIIQPCDLTLDGLLSSAVYALTGKMGADTIPDIPLARDEATGIFRASSLFYGPGARHERMVRIMALRSEHDLSMDLFAPKRKGYSFVDKKRGPFKNQLDNYPVIRSRKAVFWGNGDPDAVLAMLEVIPGLGKRATAGAGQIIGKKVIHEEQDYSWVTREEQPARPLPVSVWNDIVPHRKCATMPCSVTIPYWESSMTESVFPVARMLSR